MTSGAFDIASAVCYVVAGIACARALSLSRDRAMVFATGCALIVMSSMAVVSVSNALTSLGSTQGLHVYEEYVEIAVLPLFAYALYALYAHGQRVKVDRERSVATQLGARLSTSLDELGENRLAMLQALSTAVDARDHYTAQHSMHVADYACAIAYRMGMREQIQLLEQAGLLHDIGKIGVADTILLKPADLDSEEYRAIQRHVEESAHIIESVPFLAPVVPMVRHHHERWDGSGYPDGLAGEAIPREARILAVADAFDAMTTDRPYRLALPIETAREYLLEGRGNQFDPEILDVLIQLLDDGIVALGERSAVA